MSNEQKRLGMEVSRRKAALLAGSKSSVESWPSDRALSEISLGCGFLSLVGVGTPAVTDSKLAMWGFIAVGGIGFVSVIVLRIARFLQMRGQGSLILLLLGKWRWRTIASLFMIAVAVGAASYFEQKPQPLTLQTLFDTDFKNQFALGPTNMMPVHVAGKTSAIKSRIFFDLDGQSYFFGYYIPRSSGGYDLCKAMASQYMAILNPFRGRISMMIPGDSHSVNVDDMTFTQRVYIYHEDIFSLKQEAELADLYRWNGTSITMRGPEYLYTRQLIDANKK